MGLAGKYYLNPSSGLQFGVGFFGHGWLSLHGDYVFAPMTLVTSEAGMLYPYVGGGLGVGLFGASGWTFINFLPFNLISFDVHATGGLAWNFTAFPIDLFIEVAPGLQILPGLGIAWHGILGGRYYF